MAPDFEEDPESPTKVMELVEGARRGDRQAIDDLVIHWLRVGMMAARHFARSRLQPEILEELVNDAVPEAIRKIMGGLAVSSPDTFLRLTVRGRVSKELRVRGNQAEIEASLNFDAQDEAVRLQGQEGTAPERPARKGFPPGSTWANPTAPDGMAVMDKAKLEWAVDSLPWPENEILRLHYLEGQPMSEVEKLLELNWREAARLRDQGIDRLWRWINNPRPGGSRS